MAGLNIMTSSWRYCGVLSLTALLAACSGPADTHLVTSGTLAEFQSSLSAASEGLTAHEREAFDWAVSDMNLAALNQVYPNGTLRQIIRGEVSKVKQTYPEKVAEARKHVVEQEPVRAELGKIQARDVELHFGKDFFGIQPTISATLINNSSLGISQLDWRANLYIDGQEKSVATAVLTNDYRKSGGFNPGSEFTVTFKVGFVRGDESWSSLAIQNAATRRVVLELLPLSVLDHSNQPFLSRDAKADLTALEAGLQKAEAYSDI